MIQHILQLLARSPGTRFSVKEVGKRLDRERYKTDPNWARPYLKSLTRHADVEEEDTGFFRYRK